MPVFTPRHEPLLIRAQVGRSGFPLREVDDITQSEKRVRAASTPVNNSKSQPARDNWTLIAGKYKHVMLLVVTDSERSQLEEGFCAGIFSILSLFSRPSGLADAAKCLGSPNQSWLCGQVRSWVSLSARLDRAFSVYQPNPCVLAVLTDSVIRTTTSRLSTVILLHPHSHQPTNKYQHHYPPPTHKHQRHTLSPAQSAIPHTRL